jgi:hypothetical protein
MGQPELSSSFPDEASQSPAFDKKKNAEILASGYTKTKRTVEIISVSIFVTLLLISIVRTTSSLYFLRNFWVSLCACVLSMCIADFFSGIAHCMSPTPLHHHIASLPNAAINHHFADTEYQLTLIDHDHELHEMHTRPSHVSVILPYSLLCIYYQ